MLDVLATMQGEEKITVVMRRARLDHRRARLVLDEMVRNGLVVASVGGGALRPVWRYRLTKRGSDALDKWRATKEVLGAT